MYQIHEIEDAIIAALEADAALAAARVPVKSLGYVPDRDELKKYIAAFPAVYVVYAGEDGERIGPIGAEGITWNWTVLVGARNLRGESDARRDENSGAYWMIDRVKTALRDNDLGLSISPLEYTGTECSFISSEAAQYEVNFVSEEID